MGVDNIDITAATTRGILVVNAPGNTIAAAEHTIAMMMSMARKIPQANASLKAGKWDKKSYMGVEVRIRSWVSLGLAGLFPL